MVLIIFTLILDDRAKFRDSEFDQTWKFLVKYCSLID